MKANRERNRKRHVRKRLLCMMFAMAIAFVSVAYVSAANANPFLQGYYVQEDCLMVHCASLADMGEALEPWQFKVTISGSECAVLGVSTLGEMGEAATFYCLVDVSGSMRREQMEAAQEVLSAICHGMGERDNMVIGALGTTLEVSGFLTDKEEIEAEIEALTAGSDYTAIYDAVIDSIAVLQSSKECNEKKCLVIISDGDDETVIGKTRSEALHVIQDSRIPVYTVAALRQSHTEQQRESAKNLGAFARQSVGGGDYALAVNGYSAEEVGQFILEDIHNGLILKVDVSQADLSRDEALLKVSLELDNAVYSDDLYVYTAELRVSSSAEEEENSNDPAPPRPTGKHQPKPLPVPSPRFSWLVVLGTLAVVVLVLILSMVVICQKRKKREQEEREAREREKEKQQEQSDQRAQKKSVENRREKKQPSGLIGVQTVGAAPGVWYEVRFVAIDHEDIVFTLKISEGKAVTIGRNNKADMVLNPTDIHLSSVQCKLYCKQGSMNVWDMDSRNDTFVNGVPIRKIGMATVQNGDVMRLGSYEYRVFITRQ